MRREPRVFLGVVTAPLAPPLATQLGLPEGFGLLVQEVMPDSPASKAGLQKYDVLKLLNDQQLVQESQLATLLTAIGKDKEVSLTVIRKGQEQKVTAKPEERVLPVRAGREHYVQDLLGAGGAGFGGPGGAAEAAENMRRKAEEYRRSIEARGRALQDQIRQRRENGPGAPPHSADISPERLLREAAEAGGSQLRVESESGTTTVDGAKARLRFKDNTGEIEVAAENGSRVLTAKDSDGKVVFTGPVNTPEEKAAVPEQFRKKLEQIHVRQDGSNSISISGSTGSADAHTGSTSAASSALDLLPMPPTPATPSPESQTNSEADFQ